MAGRLVRSDSRESVFSNASCVSGVGEWQIGDRVRLDNKIGTLAYVGHTKFAPGEWIGLVLDTPDGKNNGSVQGVAYFTCDDNHGIFCKSSKLERIAHSPAVGSPMREINNKYAAEFGFDVGDRVMVSGGKIGYLRYLGPADFAEGIWCGVELDQPMGKNDGNVQGKRYFVCKPLHGLFAPAKKTEKAPKLDTPSKIRVHHNKTSMLRAHKSGSHESLNSIGASSVSSRMTTGIAPVKRSVARSINASTNETLVKALQETIQEKDKHLEQMIHERDLERNEMAEVTMRCEELERKLASGEGGGSGNIDEEKVRRLERLETDRKNMKSTLIEKEKIIEDLQFRLEEEEIMRQERESTMRELEEKLAKVSTAEAVNTFDSVSMEEKNAELAIIREEIEKLKISRDKLERERESNEKVIHDMRTTLEETELRAKKLDNDCEKVMNELEEESMKNVAMMKELNEEKKRVEELQNEKKCIEKEKDESCEAIQLLKRTMESMKSASCASCVQLKMGTEELEMELMNAKKEITDVEEKWKKEIDELEKKLKEEIKEFGMKKDEEIFKLSLTMNESENGRKELEKTLHLELEKANELKAELEKIQSKTSSLESQLVESLSIIEKKTDESDKLSVANAEYSEEVDKNRKNVEDLKKIIEGLQKEIEGKVKEVHSISVSMANLSAQSEKERKENEEMKRRVMELEECAANEGKEKGSLEQSMQQKIRELREMEGTVQTLTKELGDKMNEIERITLESNDGKVKIEELSIENKKMNELNEVLDGGKDKATKMLKETETKLASAVEKKDKVKIELDNIRTKLKTTEEKLSEKETELKCAQESLAAIESSMEVSKMSDDERSKELSGVKEELARERANIDEMKRKNEKAKEEIAEAKSEIEGLKNEIMEGEQNMEKERNERKIDIGILEVELKNSKKREEEEKKKNNEKIEDLKNEKEEEMKKQQELIEGMKKEIKEMEMKLTAIKKEEERLNDELIKEREEGGIKGTESVEWSRKYETLREEARKAEEEWKNERERLSTSVREKDVILIEREEKTKELSTVLDVLNGEMEELSKKKLNLEEELRNEREDKEKIKNENKLYKQAKEEGDANMSNLLAELEQLKTRMSVQSDENVKLKENFSLVSEDIKKEKEIRELMAKEKDTLIDSLKNLMTEKEELKVTASTASSSGEELAEKLRSSLEENEKIKKERDTEKKEKEELEKNMRNELIAEKEETEKIRKKRLEMEELLSKKEESLEHLKNQNEKERKEWENEIRELQEQLAKKEEVYNESVAKLALVECEITAEKNERRKLQAEMRLNVGDLQEKSEESFKKDTQIESLKYEKAQMLNELEKERTGKKDLAERLRMIEDGNCSTAYETERWKQELEGERRKFDDLLAQKKQAHELFDELERNWRKKEETLAEKLDGLTEELEMIKRKSVNEQMKELQNEVDLLRSIVAERVKKEEKYKKEIEILKNMPLDGTPARKEKREMAPRKFCDICEVFDTHDTEDCPTQSMEPIDPSPKKTKVLPPSRDYCDSCEEFGHDTSVCPTLFASETPKKKKDYTF